MVNKDEVPKVTNNVGISVDYIDPLIKFERNNNLKKISGSNIHYLSQSDFLSGTYRINECGEYIFTESIECNFNAPTQEEQLSLDFSPNTITGDRLYWYPIVEQSENDYPGLYTFEGHIH